MEQGTAHWQNLPQQRRNQLVGISYVLIVSAIWIGASHLVKNLEEKADPFIVTYISNALFLLYLPIAKLRECFRKPAERPSLPEENNERNGEEEIDVLVPGNTGDSNQSQLSENYYIRVGAMLAPVWWLGQFTFNKSLSLTSVTSNTILSSSSSLFTFGLSVWILKEPCVRHKMIGLFVCFAGVVVVTLADTSTGKEASNPVLGDTLTIVSAVLYGGYVVGLKKALPDEKNTNILLLLGYMGLVMAAVVGCIVWILHWLNVVNARIPLPIFGLTVAKGVLDNVLTHYLWAKSVQLVGPTVATAGLSMQTPMAIVVAIVFIHPNWLKSTAIIFLKLSGTLLVLVGFFDLNLEESLFQTIKNWIAARVVTT